MIIKRILTNNALVVADENQNEQIVCGKGIGYKKKVGEVIDSSLVNQIFVLSQSTLTSQLEELLNAIPIECVELANEISTLAQGVLGKELNETLILTLSDHLFAVLERHKDGVNISNGLIWDIQQFYEKEYNIGLTSLDLIEKKMSVRLPEAEAAYIALHLVNAELDNSSMEEVHQITKLIQDITSIVKYYFSITFDTKSAYYYRFITHIKFFAKRLIEGKVDDSCDDLELLEVVKYKYETSYKCVSKIGEFLEDKYQYKLNDDERLYLTIHVQRAVYKNHKK